MSKELLLRVVFDFIFVVVGAGIALGVASWNARREDRRKADELRRVLLADLEIVKDPTRGGIARMEKMLKDKQEGTLAVDVEARADDSYSVLLPRIGRLTQCEIELVLPTYRLRRACIHKLERIGKQDPESDRHVIVHSENFKELIVIEEKALRSINIAIAALEDKGLCRRKCGKEASEVVWGPKDPMDATHIWQSLRKPCADKLEKSGNLTKAEAAT